VPGIVARIAFGLQIVVVGLRPAIIIAVGSLAPQPVVALPQVEAAFGHPRADHRVARQTETRHAVGVDAHMGLADQHGVHARLAQMVA
jgi:hypothetical protein